MAAVPPPGPPTTNVSAGLSFLKGLTIANAAVIVLLVVALVPAYVVYRLVTDPDLLDRFLSGFDIYAVEGPCRVSKARQRGGEWTWGEGNGFAIEGRTRWIVGVVMTEEPTAEEIKSNCAILTSIIDWMHGMGDHPDFIWQMKDVQGREGSKGGGR
jgi:hypothetical protein